MGINFFTLLYKEKMASNGAQGGCYLLLSIIMGIVYGLYAFGSMGTGGDKICAADPIHYHPLNYKSQQELDTYLSRPGSINVTGRFHTVTFFGFISNCIIVGYFFAKMVVS